MRGFWMGVGGVLAVMLTGVLAWEGAGAASLDGRWILTIEDDARRLELPVDLRIEAGGKARLVVLGRTEGEDGLFTGTFAGQQLALRGRMARGAAAFALTVSGDRLAGRLTGAWVQAEVYGTRAAGAGSEIAPARYEAVLGAILNGLAQYFYDPKLKGLNPEELRARHLQKVKAARDDGELALAIRGMLAELRTSQTEFFLSLDKPQLVYKGAPVLWRQLEPRVGYLALLHLPDGRMADFDGLLSQAVADLSNYPGLILDLRGNHGGAVEPALAALNLLLPEGRPVAYFATRDALRRLKVDSIDGLNPATLPLAYADDQAATAKFQGAGLYLAGGKFRTPYKGRIAVLIDEGCTGGCELLAAAMKEGRVATLIGRRTRGALLLSTSVNFTIIGWAGFPRTQVRSWKLVAPTAEVRTITGTKVEGVGVAPDLPVERTSSEDADLARALRWLGQAN